MSRRAMTVGTAQSIHFSTSDVNRRAEDCIFQGLCSEKHLFAHHIFGPLSLGVSKLAFVETYF